MHGSIKGMLRHGARISARKGCRTIWPLLAAGLASGCVLSTPIPGGAGGGGFLDAGPASPGVPCLQDQGQVIVGGDSYMNWISHTFYQDLQKESGASYRFYALPGASLGSGGLTTTIPDQFEEAIAANPDILVGIMTGGGNDILLPDVIQFPGSANCKNRADAASVPACQAIVQKALDTAKQLMLRAADIGMRDVIYFFYPRVPEPTILGGLHPNALLDYTLPKAKALCANAETFTNGHLRCHFLDLVPLFENHPEYFAVGDIHENSTGSDVIAKAIVKMMKDNCIGQPASSGCCVP